MAPTHSRIHVYFVTMVGDELGRHVALYVDEIRNK
jgi:hypothetical protein